MNFVKNFFDSLMDKKELIAENEKNDQKSFSTMSNDIMDNELSITNNLGETADNFLKQIEVAMKVEPTHEGEKERLIDLVNSLAVCYIRLNMPHHALMKLNELQKIPGISLDDNYDFLFIKSKALYKLEKYSDTLSCCLELKALSKKPNDPLDVVLLHLNAKVQEEIQNDLIDRHKVGKSKKRDASVPRISNLIPDIIPKSGPPSPPKRIKSAVSIAENVVLESLSRISVLESFDDEETKEVSEKIPKPKSVVKKTVNDNSITRLKELSEIGRIKAPTYNDMGHNLKNPFEFLFTCTVYFGPKGFETKGSASTKKEAKHCAANQMIEELKNAKVI